MLGNYYTFPELLIWIPLITGLIAVFFKKSAGLRSFALFSSLATLVVAIISLFYINTSAHPEYFSYNHVSYVWLPYIGSSFSVVLDGISIIPVILTAVTFPLVFIATHNRPVQQSGGFYSLMLLFQAGLMGVFVAADALVFYFFWELALIPAYFLCSRWGGPQKIAATFKFFIYTFTGSLLMLIGILYIYQFTPPTGPNALHSFSLTAFYATPLKAGQQLWLFWLFFLAFAIKMPIFPFHTWQPDTYEQAPYPTVMILSAVMVKMGVYAMIRWVLPVFPLALVKFDHLIVVLCVIGIVYGSCLAIVQNDLKRLVAWASIAHLGVMGAGIFSGNIQGLQGALLEMFNHGINVLGLWIVVEIIEHTTGVRKISELGGLAKKSPLLAIFFLIIALANVGLPLTNSFASEFLMLSGIFEFNKWMAAFACLGVILSAVYMLNMMRKVFYGPVSEASGNATKMSGGQMFVLSVVVIMILVLGVYPELILRVTEVPAQAILNRLMAHV